MANGNDTSWQQEWQREQPNENISMLLSMGFDEDQARQALSACGNVEQAINFLLSDGGGGSGPPHVAPAPAPARFDHATRAVHSDVSQYSESRGRSACTAIALTLACHFLTATTADADAERVVLEAFLGEAVLEGIRLYGDLRGGSDGVEHASVEELLDRCAAVAGRSRTADRIVASLTLGAAAPRQGLLSDAPENPTGLAAVLSRCRAEAPDPHSYTAAVITKPPETVLVLLPPAVGDAVAPYLLLDSHPRPQQLAPHCPAGSYALFHATLGGLVASVEQLFPVTALGSDVPDMMAMMYNSFDVYPFQCPPR